MCASVGIICIPYDASWCIRYHVAERAMIVIVPCVGPSRGADAMISEGRGSDSFPAFIVRNAMGVRVVLWEGESPVCRA